MLGYTMNIETGGSFAPGPGGSKAAGKFDHVEMYLNEIPFGILYGDYSQSTKDFGMNYTDLKEFVHHITRRPGSILRSGDNNKLQRNRPGVLRL